MQPWLIRVNSALLDDLKDLRFAPHCKQDAASRLALLGW